MSMAKKFIYQKPTHEYIATAKCGCVVGVLSDLKGYEKETAKEVADFIKKGCAVNRVLRDSDEFKNALDNFGHYCQPEQAVLL
jgi:hypothetical protein